MMSAAEHIAELALQSQANKHGLDVRAGKRFSVRVESIAMLAEVGQVIPVGVSILENVHESDLPILRGLEEDYMTPHVKPTKLATGSWSAEVLPRKFSLESVQMHQRTMQQKQDMESPGRLPVSLEAAFYDHVGRGRKPLLKVEVLDAQGPAKAKS